MVVAMLSRGRRSAVTCALVLVALAPPAAARAATPLVRTTVDTRFHGPKLARSFLGFSQEYNALRTWLGGPVIGVNPLLVNISKQLASYGSGPPVLRLGGGSADAAWWNPTGRKQPAGISFNLNNRLMVPLGKFLTETGGTAVPGLKPPHRHPAYARGPPPAAQAALPQGSIPA